MFNNTSLLRKAQILAVVLVICVSSVVIETFRATRSINSVNTEFSTHGIPFLMGAQEFRIHVLQIQQWLTDISATRGQDGLNDGFTAAEEHHQLAKHFGQVAAIDFVNDENEILIRFGVCTLNKVEEVSVPQTESRIGVRSVALNEILIGR